MGMSRAGSAPRRWPAGTRCATDRRFRNAGEGLGDHPFVAAAVLAEQQRQSCSASMTRSGAGDLAVGDEGVGDVAGHPFLVGEAVADGVDKAGDAARNRGASPAE